MATDYTVPQRKFRRASLFSAAGLLFIIGCGFAAAAALMFAVFGYYAVVSGGTNTLLAPLCVLAAAITPGILTLSVLRSSKRDVPITVLLSRAGVIAIGIATPMMILGIWWASATG
jgi:hypothetical protein